PSARISVDPVEGLHLLRVWLVASLAFLVVVLAVGARVIRQRCGGGGDGSARAERAQEFTTAERGFAFSFHRRLLLQSSSVTPSDNPDRLCASRRSRRQREGLGFDLHEHPAERSHAPVEVRTIGLLQVSKKAPNPGLQILLEQFAIGARGSGKSPAHQPCHDLAQDRSMILGLRLAGCALDPKLLEMRAQPRERPLVQEAGEIIRTIWEKFPAPDAYEELEIFALDALHIGPLRRVRERGVRQSERARIATQCGKTLQ